MVAAHRAVRPRPEENARWFAEVELLRQALNDWRPNGAVLELACGTGLWSRELAPSPSR